MKTITTIFESILGQDDRIVWGSDNGPSEFANKGWGWGVLEGGENKGWGWGV